MSRSKQLVMTVLTLCIVIAGIFLYKQLIEDKPEVVVVLKDFNIEYWHIIKAGNEKGFKDFGVDGKVVATENGTVEEQIQLLDEVLKEKPDVLAIAPIHQDVIPKLEEFYEADIPVLFIHTNEPWDKKTAYIGSDDVELGARAGILMASQLQPGEKVALLGRQLVFEIQRLKGAKASLEAAGIEIVAEHTDLPDGNEHFPKAGHVMKSILEEHPDIKGVVASTDYLAIPALEVILEQGNDVIVMGPGGVMEMLHYVKDGSVPITASQNPYDMGYISAETAAKVANGEKVNKEIYTGIDIVTKGNAEQRIEFYKHALSGN